jgi:NhaA family Na+:H+ antiporter
MPEDVDSPPSATLPIDAIASPFVRFAKMESAGGILLLASTIAALVWANSRWEASYHALWNTQVVISIGHFFLSESRHEWINDGLMSIFFFLVGLEIKREVLIGELSSLRQATSPSSPPWVERSSRPSSTPPSLTAATPKRDGESRWRLTLHLPWAC